MNKIVKFASIVGFSTALLGMAASPASASTALVGVGLDSAGAYKVVSVCNIVAGYTTDVRFINYVVTASADAAGPSVALATGVTCTIYGGGTARGGASGSLIGPHAEAVGFATLPVGQVPTACVSGGATFLSGASVVGKPCP